MLRTLRHPPRAFALPATSSTAHGRSATPQWIAARLSTQAPRRNKQQQTKQDPKPNPAQQDLPAFSLEGLGVSRNMRIFLFTLLGIYGTIETWFYCKWIYQWWYGEKIKSAE